MGNDVNPLSDFTAVWNLNGDLKDSINGFEFVTNSDLQFLEHDSPRGNLGKFADFDGDDWAQIEDLDWHPTYVPKFAATPAITYSLWVNVIAPAPLSVDSRFINTLDDTHTDYGTCSLRPNGQLYVHIGSISVSAGSLIGLGWHHLLWGRQEDGGSCSLWVNGVHKENWIDSVMLQTKFLTLGSRVNGFNMHGPKQMDQFAWGGGIPPSTALAYAIYNNGKGVFGFEQPSPSGVAFDSLSRRNMSTRLSRLMRSGRV